MKILLTISYLGTNYSGFQVQKNAVTVQQTLQDAVQAVFGYRCLLTGCGRTDSGVHANAYCCTIELKGYENQIPLCRIPDALNHSLPRDISVSKAVEVSNDFHPRYDAVYKEYIYIIWNERYPNPFFHDRAYHYPRLLDDKIMNGAAAYLTGRHDFAAFMASGSNVKDTIREIYRADLKRTDGFVRFTIAGNGFLYNMVRIITGTLICVSEGKIPADGIFKIIEQKERSAAGFTVPAHGLYLNRVVYKTDAR